MELTGVALAHAGLALAGIAYLLIALSVVQRSRLRAENGTGPAFCPPATILKPLCGEEPGLYQCLRSFCLQDYPVYQIVFGIRDSDDKARAVVERLMAEFPHLDLTLVCDARIRGPNLKVSNLVNMMAACRHDIVVISDSDVLVDPRALAAAIAPLAESSVGAVTCLYAGTAMGGLAARLGAAYINDWFLPSALVDHALSGVDGCWGPLTAVRRTALADAGGLEALAGYLADDNRLGRLLRRAGWEVRLCRHVVHTMSSEASLGELISHEMRWGRTVRTCRPSDHLLSLVTFPLPLLIALLAAAPTRWGAGLTILFVALRFVLHFAVRSRLPGPAKSSAWLLPLRELICFAVWAISLVGRRVTWRRRNYLITADGGLEVAGLRDGDPAEAETGWQWRFSLKVVAMISVATAIDWMTPPEFEVFALYAAATFVAAGLGGRWQGMLAALLAIVSIVLQGTFQGNPYSSTEFFLLAVANKMAVLAAVGVLTPRRRRDGPPPQRDELILSRPAAAE